MCTVGRLLLNGLCMQFHIELSRPVCQLVSVLANNLCSTCMTVSAQGTHRDPWTQGNSGDCADQGHLDAFPECETRWHHPCLSTSCHIAVFVTPYSLVPSPHRTRMIDL